MKRWQLVHHSPIVPELHGMFSSLLSTNWYFLQVNPLLRLLLTKPSYFSQHLQLYIQNFYNLHFPPSLHCWFIWLFPAPTYLAQQPFSLLARCHAQLQHSSSSYSRDEAGGHSDKTGLLESDMLLLPALRWYYCPGSFDDSTLEGQPNTHQPLGGHLTF